MDANLPFRLAKTAVFEVIVQLFEKHDVIELSNNQIIGHEK